MLFNGVNTKQDVSIIIKLIPKFCHSQQFFVYLSHKYHQCTSFVRSVLPFSCSHNVLRDTGTDGDIFHIWLPEPVLITNSSNICNVSHVYIRDQLDKRDQCNIKKGSPRMLNEVSQMEVLGPFVIEPIESKRQISAKI